PHPNSLGLDVDVDERVPGHDHRLAQGHGVEQTGQARHARVPNQGNCDETCPLVDPGQLAVWQNRRRYHLCPSGETCNGRWRPQDGYREIGLAYGGRKGVVVSIRLAGADYEGPIHLVGVFDRPVELEVRPPIESARSGRRYLEDLDQLAGHSAAETRQ